MRILLFILLYQPIGNDDEQSKEICCTCWEILHNFHNFYEKIRIAHYYLAHTENVYTEPIDKIHTQNNPENFNDFTKSMPQDMNTNKSSKSSVIKLKKKRKKLPISRIEKTNTNDDDVEIMMPKNFHSQDKTEDIFQRFHKMYVKIRNFLLIQKN